LISTSYPTSGSVAPASLLIRRNVRYRSVLRIESIVPHATGRSSRHQSNYSKRYTITADDRRPRLQSPELDRRQPLPASHCFPGSSNRAMSRSQDDYVAGNHPQDQVTHSRDTEPADPDNADHTARRDQPLAPDSVNINRIPDPFITDNGQVETVADAGETYLKVVRSNWNEKGVTSKHERHKSRIYPRILHADRHFQEEYDGLTTVMLTRRLSPIDDANNWLTPWESNEMLHGGSIHRSVRRALSYQLDDFDFEWVAVTAPTESAGTPHEHIYLWIDDPHNIVTADHIVSARDKHIKHCANASKKDHRYRVDGAERTITVRQTPPLAKQGGHKGVAKQVIRDNTAPYANTAGAKYLASQLAHLPIADYYHGEKQTPPQALFEGAALAWASTHDWLRSSRGVPLLG